MENTKLVINQLADRLRNEAVGYAEYADQISDTQAELVKFSNDVLEFISNLQSLLNQETENKNLVHIIEQYELGIKNLDSSLSEWNKYSGELINMINENASSISVNKKMRSGDLKGEASPHFNSDLTNQELTDLFESGIGIQEIADSKGMTYNGVRQRLIRLGLYNVKKRVNQGT
jgi:hypothetical protein